MSMLEVSRLSAGYDGTDVLHKVSFSVKPGENLCILGANGCGKTTLLRAVAGLLPYSGEVTLDGRELRRMKRRELAAQIAVLSQTQTIYFSYTVWDTVMLGRYQHMRSGLFAAPTAADREVVEGCLRTTGLLDLRQRQLDTLSGGQLQRVFLARALAQQPRIILLDEPTNHLDLKHQVALVDHLREWSSDGEHTVIGVLHDVNLALRLSDRLLFLRDGRTMGLGSAAELLTAELLQAVYGMDVAGYMRDTLRKWGTFAPAADGG